MPNNTHNRFSLTLHNISFSMIPNGMILLGMQQITIIPMGIIPAGIILVYIGTISLDKTRD